MLHADEPHRGGIAQRLDWLRAGVPGANVGIVSVSNQSDSERALIAKERSGLRDMPAEELDELTALDRQKGLNETKARRVIDWLVSR